MDYSKTIQVAMGNVVLRHDGIIHVVLRDDHFVELEDRIELVAAIETLCEGNKMPLLIDTGERMDISKEARSYDMETRINEMVSMEALVINSLPTRIAARFYYKLRNPSFKIRTFGTREEALEWLHQEQSGLKKAN